MPLPHITRCAGRGTWARNEAPNTVGVVSTFNSLRPRLPLKTTPEERRGEQEGQVESSVLALHAVRVQVIRGVCRQGESVRQDAGCAVRMLHFMDLP